MDSHNDIMHAFLEEEEAATADQEENFTIFCCLLQLHAAKLNYADQEVTSLGEGRARKGRGWRMEGHTILYAD
jgi:hypothetical protein